MAHKIIFDHKLPGNLRFSDESVETPTVFDFLTGPIRIKDTGEQKDIFDPVLGKIRSGALLNLPEWTTKDYFALPVINLTVGEYYTIYGDTLINVPIENNLTVEYTCEIGSQSGNKDFTITPEVANVGVHTLTAVFKENNKQFLSKTITLNISQKVASGTIKILMIGDSIVVQRVGEISNQINSELSSLTVEYVGTQGTTIKHEGHGGWSWLSFIYNGSPFMKNGVLNIPAYFSDNAVAIPDIVHLRIGVNDMFGNSANDLTDVEMTTILGYATEFINCFLNLNATIKVILSLPTLTGSTSTAWNIDYDETVYNQDKFIEISHKFWKGLIDEYSFNERIALSAEPIFIDRENDYPVIAGGGVHPSSTGGAKIGKGIASNINYLYSLIPTELTLSLISGGVRLDWTDNTSGEYQTEIYGKSEDGEYSLVTTVAAGVATYNDILNAVDLRYYKLRGKNGDFYTDFSSEQSIAMLGAEKVVNGNFANWTGDNPNNWTVSESSPDLVTNDNGACRFLTNSYGVAIYQNCGMVNGHKYRVRINVTNRVSGVLSINYSSDYNYTTINSAGIHDLYVIADGVLILLKRAGLPLDMTVALVSIKEVLVP